MTKEQLGIVSLLLGLLVTIMVSMLVTTSLRTELDDMKRIHENLVDMHNRTVEICAEAWLYMPVTKKERDLLNEETLSNAP